MRYMMFMIPNPKATAETWVPTPEAVEAMMAYNQQLQQSGVLLTAEGLDAPSKTVRVAFAGGRPTVTDGPFAEAKEFIGGYWMIQVKSHEEAIEWARRVPAADGDVIELRRVTELEDFPPEVQAAAKGR